MLFVADSSSQLFFWAWGGGAKTYQTTFYAYFESLNLTSSYIYILGKKTNRKTFRLKFVERITTNESNIVIPKKKIIPTTSKKDNKLKSF